MAVVTISGVHTDVAKGVILTTWSFLRTNTSGSIGKPLSAPNYPDKTVTSRGPWASGVTIVIQGSNTATYSTGTSMWFTLTSPLGSGLSMSTGKIRAILENPRWIRPRISARTGTSGTPIIEIVSQSTKR